MSKDFTPRIRIRKSKNPQIKWEVVGGGFKTQRTQHKSTAIMMKKARIRIKLKRALRRKGIQYYIEDSTPKLRSLLRRKKTDSICRFIY